MKRIDWFFLTLIVYGFFIADLFMVAMMDFVANYEFLAVFCMGVCVGQLNLIGAWGALVPGKVIVRLPWAAFLGVLMWQAMIMGQSSGRGMRNDERLMLGVAIGFGVVVTQVPLWLARRPFGWRLVPPRFSLDNLASMDAQFNLKHLFLGMVFASLALAMARFTLADVTMRDFDVDGEILLILAIVAIWNALVTAPCIWLAFNQGGRLIVGAAAWTLYVLLASAIEVFVLIFFLGSPGGSNGAIILFFALFNLAQCLTVFATMLLLQGIGFRLVRANQQAATVPAAVATPE